MRLKTFCACLALVTYSGIAMEFPSNGKIQTDEERNNLEYYDSFASDDSDQEISEKNEPREFDGEIRTAGEEKADSKNISGNSSKSFGVGKREAEGSMYEANTKHYEYEVLPKGEFNCELEADGKVYKIDGGRFKSERKAKNEVTEYYNILEGKSSSNVKYEYEELPGRKFNCELESDGKVYKIDGGVFDSKEEAKRKVTAYYILNRSEYSDMSNRLMASDARKEKASSSGANQPSSYNSHKEEKTERDRIDSVSRSSTSSDSESSGSSDSSSSSWISSDYESLGSSDSSSYISVNVYESGGGSSPSLSPESFDSYDSDFDSYDSDKTLVKND